MTYQHPDFTLPAELMEQIAEQGFEALPELIRILVNEAMRMERQNYLGVAPYQRSPARRGHGNGFKDHTERTRVGEITFAIPQMRESGFFPQALEKGLRSERALTLSLAEMYVHGVSTRKVSAIVEELCGSSVSSSQVSRAAGLLDEKLAPWRQRPLGEMVYQYLDARYEKVHQDGQIRDAAVLIATAVDPRHRQVLGVSVALSEQEVHWRTFLQSLVARGLRGLQLIISDDHAGLKAARQAVFGGAPWQRCQAGRLAGKEHPGRLGRLRLPSRPAAPATHQQQPGVGQSGTRAPHEGGQHLPERGRMPASGQCGPDRTG